jgi:hypothetical protein
MRKDREKGKEEGEKRKRGKGVLKLRRPPSPIGGNQWPIDNDGDDCTLRPYPSL